MVNKTCAKCGAKIPADAKFCLNCGAPITAEEPQAAPTPSPQPVQTQPTAPPTGGGVQAPVRQTGNIFDTLFSKNLIIGGTLLGILLAWIGKLITGFVSGGATAGTVLNSIGFAAMGTFLVGGGLVNQSFDKNIRLGMIVGGSILIAMGFMALTFSFTYPTSPYGY